MADPKLTEYIKTSLAQGKSREDIYKELLGQGRSVEAIQENFPALTTAEDKEETAKRTIRIIVAIGTVLIGAGIFSFIAANWQAMTRPVKIVIILVSMFLSYAAGWHLKGKSKLLKTGEALILLGAIIYGAGIFLVAQIFHIRANWPDGFILWMIGTLAMAFAVDSYILFCLAIALGFVALVGHPFCIFTGMGHNVFLLTSTLLLLVATAGTFAAAWFVRKKMPPELKEYY